MTEKNRATLKEVQADYKHSLVRALLFDLKAAKLPAPVEEHHFHPTRKWRADLAWPDEMVLVEVDGGTGQNRDAPSRHLTPSGYREDCEKLNAAACLGFCVIRLTPAMARDGTGVETIGRALKARRTKGARGGSVRRGR